MNRTRFRATVLDTEFVPKLDKNLSSSTQCGLDVQALRLRLSVTHAQPETEPTEGEWYVVNEPGYPDLIVDLFVGYTPGKIHLWAGSDEHRFGGSYDFDLAAPAEMWVWSVKDTPRVKYASYNSPRRTSRATGSRVLHQFSFPAVLQRVVHITPPHPMECVPVPLPLPV